MPCYSNSNSLLLKLKFSVAASSAKRPTPNNEILRGPGGGIQHQGREDGWKSGGVHQRGRDLPPAEGESHLYTVVPV